MRVCGLARSYIKSSNPHSVAWVCLLAFPSSEGWRGVCLKKTANQAENEATVCVRSCVLELKRKGKKKEKQRSLTQIWIYGRLERKPQPTKKPLTLSSNRKSDLFIYVCSIFPAIRRPRVSPRSEQLDLWFVHSREPLQRHRAKTR